MKQVYKFTQGKHSAHKLPLALGVLLASVLFPLLLSAQNAGLGTATPDPSALLDLTSTTQGLLVPRLATADRNAIGNPATGLLIYNTDSDRFEYNEGTPGAPQWVELVPENILGSTSWSLSGNSGTNPATQFIGTSDGQALVLRTNNVERVRVLSGGNVGISTNNPLSLFSVGPASEFQVSAAGAIVAATGLAASGNIDLTSLNGGGLVRAAAGTGRLSIATGGTDFELPLSFANGLTRSGVQVNLGGNLTTNTIITGGAFNLSFTGTGNFGVGVTVPSVKLDVDGGARIADLAGAGNRMVVAAADGSLNTQAIPAAGVSGSGQATRLAYWTVSDAIGSDANLFWHETTASLGVLTGNPQATFSVGVTSQFQVNSTGQIASASGINAGGNIDFAALNAGGLVSAAAVSGRLGLAVADVDYQAPLSFANGLQRSGNTVGLGGSLTTNTVITMGGNDLLLTGAGNVGVGTAAPAQRLDVAGAINIGTTTTGTAGALRWDGTDFEGHNGTDWVSLTAGGGASAAGAWNVTGNTIGGSDFLGSLNSQDLAMRTNNIERMRLTTGGNVGIGLTQPQQRLDVNGALRLGNTASATSGTIRWTGVDFEGFDGSVWQSLTALGGSGNGWSVTGNTVSAGNFLGSVNAEALRFRTDNVQRMEIHTNGNVGIGVAAPTRLLEVNGTARIGTSGTTITNVIKATITQDVGNVAGNSPRVETFTVNGAQPGASVMISPELELGNGLIISYVRVSALNTVEVKFYNVRVAAVNPPSMEYYITVIE